MTISQATIDHIATQMDNCTSLEEMQLLRAKSAGIQDLLAAQDTLAVTGCTEEQAVKIKLPKLQSKMRKSYDISEVKRFETGDTISYTVKDWSDAVYPARSKPIAGSERTFTGKIVGRVEINGTLNLAVLCEADCAGFNVGEVYAFQPNSIRYKFKNHSE